MTLSMRWLRWLSVKCLPRGGFWDLATGTPEPRCDSCPLVQLPAPE